MAKIRIKLIHKRVGKKNYKIRFSDFSEKTPKQVFEKNSELCGYKEGRDQAHSMTVHLYSY